MGVERESLRQRANRKRRNNQLCSLALLVKGTEREEPERQAKEPPRCTLAKTQQRDCVHATSKLQLSPLAVVPSEMMRHVPEQRSILKFRVHPAQRTMTNCLTHFSRRALTLSVTKTRPAALSLPQRTHDLSRRCSHANYSTFSTHMHCVVYLSFYSAGHRNAPAELASKSTSACVLKSLFQKS